MKKDREGSSREGSSPDGLCFDPLEKKKVSQPSNTQSFFVLFVPNTRNQSPEATLGLQKRVAPTMTTLIPLCVCTHISTMGTFVSTLSHGSTQALPTHTHAPHSVTHTHTQTFNTQSKHNLYTAPRYTQHTHTHSAHTDNT